MSLPSLHACWFQNIKFFSSQITNFAPFILFNPISIEFRIVILMEILKYESKHSI